MSAVGRFALITLLGACLINVAAAQTPATGPATEPGAASSPHQQGATGKTPMRADKNGADPATFVKEAAQGGMTEVQVAKVALSKTQDPSVRTFAEQMVKDHGKANMELAGIAKRKGLDVPAALDAEHKAIVQKLSAKSGAEFDSAYSKQMMADHDKTLALFADASQSRDTDIAAFAQKTLPTLKEHRKMADSLPSSSHSADAHESPTQR
jgi:putative membrane protein